MGALKSLAACLVATFVCVAIVTGVQTAMAAPRVPGPALPNHHLTPGARFPVGRAKICKVGYSARVRDVPESLKDRAYARYGIKRVAYAYEVPLEP